MFMPEDKLAVESVSRLIFGALLLALLSAFLALPVVAEEISPQEKRDCTRKVAERYRDGEITFGTMKCEFYKCTGDKYRYASECVDWPPPQTAVEDPTSPWVVLGCKDAILRPLDPRRPDCLTILGVVLDDGSPF